jgi:hypothetical protein
MADRSILLAKQSKNCKAYQAKELNHMKKESKESREPNYAELRVNRTTTLLATNVSGSEQTEFN